MSTRSRRNRSGGHLDTDGHQSRATGSEEPPEASRRFWGNQVYLGGSKRLYEVERGLLGSNVRGFEEVSGDNQVLTYLRAAWAGGLYPHVPAGAGPEKIRNWGELAIIKRESGRSVKGE